MSLHREHRVDPLIETYVNRLSDLLFVLSRWIGHHQREREFLWERPLEREAALRAARATPRKKTAGRPVTRKRR